MVKYSSIPLIAIIGLALLVSGCIYGKDNIPEVESSPGVQQLSNESLSAKIALTYWSKEDVAKLAKEISQQCEKSIEPAAMYRITIREGDLKVVSWVDAETRILICSATDGIIVPSASIPMPVNTSVPLPVFAPSNGRMQLRVYKCSDLDVYKDLGFISGEISIDFDWETLAEGWWEGAGWKLMVNGEAVVDEGIPVTEYGVNAGHVTKNVKVSGNVQLMYRIYQSSHCRNGDHFNTFMWVDNVAINRDANFSDNFDDKDISDWSKKTVGNAGVTVTAD